MTLSTKAKLLISDLSQDNIKLGEIKKLAKEIKVDHALALELWQYELLPAKLLATLIFDKKELKQALIETLIGDMSGLSEDDNNQLIDWLLANQFMKNKALINLMLGWKNHSLSELRRSFWYYQARLRWTGQTPPHNSESILTDIEKDLMNESANVQWAMNFCAAQIGLFEQRYRDRCIQLGEKTQLYKSDKVSKNCTPSYLPEFIRIELAKRQ